MIARLFLLMLLALLPVPASAVPPCHGAMPVKEEHHAPARSDHEGAPADQLCVGCVAPATLRAPVLATPMPFPAPPAASAPVNGTRLPSAAPATPPPRSAA